MEIKKKIYVKNADKFIYTVAEIEVREDGLLNVWLDFVCGIDADKSELGYIGKGNFGWLIENEFIICDIMNDSLTQALKMNGYEVIEELPQIHGK